MTEYAMAGNIWSAPVLRDYTAWPRANPEAEVIDAMGPGDILIPKFAGSALTDLETNLPRFEEFARDLEIDPDEAIQLYEAEVEEGNAALPYLLLVTDQLADLRARGTAWARVRVEKIDVEYPLDTKEFLRLRALPDEIAVQFKGMVGRGRHFQVVPTGTAAQIRAATAYEDRGAHLRQFSVVEAADEIAALNVLEVEGRSQWPGDLVLVVNREEIVGLFDFDEEGGEFAYLEGKAPRPPTEIRDLFEEAALRKNKAFSTRMARRAIGQIVDLLDSPSRLLVVDDYRGFYDPFRMLNRRITQALEVRKLPVPSGSPPPGIGPVDGAVDEGEEDEESTDVLEVEALEGLEVESVRAALPAGFEVGEEVLAEAVTALRSGKHLLLSGPPGTGKSTLAEALCRAVVKEQFRVATATADWTTFDTIGGYMPSENGSLHFEPGIVLRCLRSGGQWLVVDEINRADIDKAFGPLFSVLAGTGDEHPHQDIELPFQQDKRSVHIHWSASQDAGSEYVVTPLWRLIGTLNSSDKASLFQLSFAFLRRFALVEVPLPRKDAYRAWFAARLDGTEESLRSEIAAAAINLALVKDRELGPAILGDIARFINKALLESSTGQSVFDARTAFLAAVRLLAVAQYEGARPEPIKEAEGAILQVWPQPPEPQWSSLRAAFEEVGLA